MGFMHIDYIYANGRFMHKSTIIPPVGTISVSDIFETWDFDQDFTPS